MRLIFVPLCLMLFLAVLTQAMAWGTYSDFEGTNSSFNQGAVNNTMAINSNSSSYQIEGYEMSAGFDAETGALALIVGIIALGALIGIRVLGSGLSETSVSVIYKSVGFFAFWGVLSAFAVSGISMIPVFGWLLYLFLTIVYALGVIQQVGGTSY